MTVYGYRKEKSFVSYPLLDQDQSLGKFYLFYIKPSLAFTYNDGHGFYGWYILHVKFLFILPPVLLSKSPLACKFVLLSEASTSLSILIRDLLKFLWEGRDGELPPLQNVPQKLVDKLGNIRKILNIIITRLRHFTMLR